MDKPKFDLVRFIDQKNEIIKDEKVFEPSFIPESLIHRERELEQLATHFKSIIAKNPNNSGKQIIVQGSVGLGKTAVVKKFGETLESYCKNESFTKNIASIIYFHINCRRQRSWYLIFTSILRTLIPAFPLRGFSTDELITYLARVLEERKQSILMCLDEIDYLLSSSEEQNVLYSLVRHHEGSYNKTYANLSLILVTRNPIFNSMLDPAISSSLTQNLVFFKPYTEEQLFDILVHRAHDGLFENTYSNEVISLISSFVYEQGDARYAIELLWRSARIAEQEKARKIDFEHVRKAQVSVFPIKHSIITELSPQLKYVLHALALLLKFEKENAYVTTNEVRKKYEELCEEANIRPRKQTQFWSYLKELSKYGLIKLIVQNRHKNGLSAGRVTSIGISDLPIDDLLYLLD